MVRHAPLFLLGGRPESVGGLLLDGGDRETGEVKNCGWAMEGCAPSAFVFEVGQLRD